VLAVMDEREVDGTEPPRTVAGALAASDVFIAPTTRSISHTAPASGRTWRERAGRRCPASPRHARADDGGRLST